MSEDRLQDLRERLEAVTLETEEKAVLMRALLELVDRVAAIEADMRRHRLLR